ncbi:hypothetical protein V8F44DRAFT_613809 [Aspergillus fumigatus]
MLRTSWLVLQAFFCLFSSFLFVDIPSCRIPLWQFSSTLIWFHFPFFALCMTQGRLGPGLASLVCILL